MDEEKKYNAQCSCPKDMFDDESFTNFASLITLCRCHNFFPPEELGHMTTYVALSNQNLHGLQTWRAMGKEDKKKIDPKVDHTQKRNLNDNL